MRVRSGFNTEFGRTKFDVTIEDCDLTRMLVEAGLDAEKAGETAEFMPATTVFKLMCVEAELFAKSVQYKQDQDPVHLEAIEQEVTQLKVSREELLKPWLEPPF